MNRRRIVLLVIVAIPLALMFRLSLRADPPRTPAVEEPFAGKIVKVGERSNPNVGATLEEVHIRRLGDQTFLVGKGVSVQDSKGWYEGRIVWVPVNDLSYIYEFVDRAELSKIQDEQRGAGR
jgi:hypothetical protein